MKNYIYILLCGAFILLTILSCSSDSTTYYNLSVISTPSEGGSTTPSSGEFEKGQEVEISATPNEDWAFERWHGDYIGSNPVATIQMDSSMVIAASFIKRDYPLTIHIEGGGQVSQQVVRSKSTDYPHGTTVELTADPDHGWYFSHWEENLESEENPAEITIEEEMSITAVFERLDFPLTVDVEGEGTVTQQVVPAKSTDYTFETVIELSATPESGWTFARWEGDLDGNENPIQITIDDEKEVTAVFEENEYTLTVLIEGEGEVEQTMIGAKQTDYPFGSSVSLEAFAVENWGFSHWNEDQNHTDNPIVVTVRRDTTITANFSLAPSVATKEVTAITDSSAVTGGIITSDGDFTITAHGVCFDTSERPGLDNTCTNNGTGAGEFNSLISGLVAETDYYVRAYATYSGRTVYGNQESFTTAASVSVPGAPVITDVIGGDREITVHFEEPEEDGGSPITHYEYRLNFDTDDPDADHPDINVGLESSFTIRDGENDGEGAYEIINGVEYIVRLRAVNEAGSGDWAESEPVIPHSNGIYPHKNGVTILCPNATLGNIGTVNGIEYEVVDRAVLDQKINDQTDVTRVCTSLITDMSELFGENIVNQDIGSWDVSNVTDMNRMFLDNFHFDQDISAWDVSNVTDMSYMFFYAERFNQPISEWNVSSVTDMSYMFVGDTNPNEDGVRFNQDIGEWDVSGVTNMQGMFFGASFNKDISEWDVSNVTDMSVMFRDANFNQPLNKWDVSKVTDMNRMFSVWHREANPFNQDISEWDVNNVTNMSQMFNGSVFNQDISRWDVSSVISMAAMFSGESYEGYHYNPFNQDISNWEVGSVTNMSDMFFYSEFNQDIGDWDVSKVVSMNGMFVESAFNRDISEWDVSKVTSMKRMFSYAVSFNQNLSGWCVVNISSKPDEFDDGANRWRQPRPVWGTCPGED